jgi:Flp pilus assembly protein TadD
MTEVEQSRRSSERSAAHQKTLATLLFHEGSVFSDLNLKETMLVAYEQAIQLAPHEAILHLHRGHALEQMGRMVEAKRAYEEAHRLGYDFASSFDEERRS